MRAWALPCWPYRLSLRDCLHHLTGPGLPYVDDRLAHDLEEESRSLEVVIFTSDHYRERAVPGPDVPAGDRGVQHPNAPFSGGVGQPPGENRRGGAHVDDEGTVSGSFQQSALPGYHLIHFGRSREHGDNCAARLRDLPGRIGDPRPALR